MADPKLMRIMQVLADRQKTILKTNGFFTDIGKKVERYERVFDEAQLPASSIFLGSGEKTDNKGGATKTDPTFTIRGSSVFTGVAEDTAIKMLADIHQAIEVLTTTIPQQPDLIRRVEEQSWQILYPENQGKVVSIEVVYSFSYSRKYGED